MAETRKWVPMKKLTILTMIYQLMITQHECMVFHVQLVTGMLDKHVVYQHTTAGLNCWFSTGLVSDSDIAMTFRISTHFPLGTWNFMFVYAHLGKWEPFEQKVSFVWFYCGKLETAGKHSSGQSRLNRVNNAFENVCIAQCSNQNEAGAFSW